MGATSRRRDEEAKGKGRRRERSTIREKRPAVIRWLVTGLSRVNLVNNWINQFLSLNASVSPTDVLKKAEHYNQR